MYTKFTISINAQIR